MATTHHTAARPEPLVRIKCSTCSREFWITTDALRDHTDSGMELGPRCEPCRTTPPKPVKPLSARRRAKLTKVEKVLLAVAEWMQSLDKDIPQSHAVIAAWKSDGMDFGLKGFEETYPAENRVILCLVNLVSAGLLERPAELHYRLTPAGRAKVATLTTPEGN